MRKCNDDGGVVPMRSANQTVRGRSPRPGLACLLGSVLAAGILMTAIPVAAADPSSPFAAISGSVDAGTYDMSVAGLPVPNAHPNVIARLTQTGSSRLYLGSDGGNGYVGSGDVIWVNPSYSSLDPGATPSVTVSNNDDANGAAFSVELFDEPTAPLSYAGVSSTASNASQLLFLTPGTAPYVANVSVSGGAIQVSGGSSDQTFEDFGQYSLGTISSGTGEIDVAPVAGPQTQWSISISPEPITITGQQFNHVWSQPGINNTLHFSVDGDTHLTAQIENASGTVVRTLASGLFEGAGAHTLIWDGRDSNGNPVPTGTYTAKLTSDDPVGNVANASASIGIDSTPPTVSLAHTTLRPTQAVLVRFADDGSGLTSGSITIDGAHKQVLRQGETTLSYGPRRWAPGRHQVVAVTTDRAGNRTVRTLSFRAKGNPTMPIRTGLTGPTRTRPGIVVLSVDGSGLLGGITGRHPTESTRGNPFGRLHWTTWNATQGRARGAEWINNCIPSCGQGVYRAFKATVHVYDPSSTGVFQRMTIATPSKRLRTYSALYADGAWGWN
jgi:hypothetical protein